MNCSLDCLPCFLRQSLEAVRSATQDTTLQETVVRQVLRRSADFDFRCSPPVLGQAVHRWIRELSGVKDPYRQAKRHFNLVAREVLPELFELVRQAPDPLLAAALCAVSANAIDLAAVGTIETSELVEALRRAPTQHLCGDFPAFRDSVTAAKKILYLADNAGEIAIDRLLIQQLGPERVTVAVRGSPVLNDATRLDAQEVGLEGWVEVVDNGSDAPGTLLWDCCESFRLRFAAADLVLAKGLGNYESLNGVERPVAFLFKVKCPAVSRQVGLPIGSFVLSQKRPTRRDPNSDTQQAEIR